MAEGQTRRDLTQRVVLSGRLVPVGARGGAGRGGRLGTPGRGGCCALGGVGGGGREREWCGVGAGGGGVGGWVGWSRARNEVPNPEALDPGVGCWSLQGLTPTHPQMARRLSQGEGGKGEGRGRGARGHVCAPTP